MSTRSLSFSLVQVRNMSEDQRDVLLPDLRHGWQYQPLAREGRQEMHWRADDPTLTVEALGGEGNVTMRSLS